MRKLGSALAALLLLGAVGCNEKDEGSSSTDGLPELRSVQPTAAAAPDDANPWANAKALPKQAEELRDAVAQPVSNAPQAKQALDKLFDGNTNQGDVSDPNVVAAPSQSVIDRKGQRWQQELAQRANSKLGRSGDKDAPVRGTLPEVPLPDPSLAKGDKNVRGGGPVIVAFDAFMRTVYSAYDKAYSRAAWGAAPSTAGEGKHKPSRVTIHHTAGAKQTMTVAETLAAVKNTQAFHQAAPEWVEQDQNSKPKGSWDKSWVSTKGKKVNVGGRGWGDIGYHFLVDGGGNVIEGRPADVMGAHVWGSNRNNIGISNIGNYDKDQLTEAQKTSLKRLIAFLALRYRTDPKQKGFIQGHHHFEDSSTGCPGKNLDAFLPELRLLVEQDTLDIVAKGDKSFTPLVIVDGPTI
jgi:hypothetical protein